MKTGLKKSQKTTIIEFDEQSPRITVSTHNTDLKNRLGAYARRWPECCREAAREFSREHSSAERLSVIKRG